ncbi:phosphatase PAP2 family protein [Bacillus cytotoxicus]|uniref:phosphatase PAP2 family protein n=1 Tax=Bacillus cytotoxicus TaxID=580165 RepID=UPI002446C2DA|nr:phosphatase PAP2 family protein [Bacillus cytotoxicus]MDH2886646.1 phosphatase PAP2 family protein [Bacillus cytotoxicus]
MKKKLHQYELLCMVLFCIIFGIVAWRVQANGVTMMDTYVQELVKGLQTDRLLVFFSYFTKMGSAIGITSVLIFSLLIFLKKRYYVAMFLYPFAILTTHLVNKGIKEIVKRDRPSLNEAFDALGYSFPSGHAMLSIMTYGFLAYIIAANLHNTMSKYISIIIAALFIIWIGLSRIILFVHYPTDVLAGYVVGGILLIVTIYFHRLISERFQVNQER